MAKQVEDEEDPVERHVTTQDTIPARQRARRDISGRTPSGVEIRGMAFADPIPGSLDYGPFYGEGNFSLVRSGSYVVGNIQFAEIPEIIALLVAVLNAAEAGEEGG